MQPSLVVLNGCCFCVVMFKSATRDLTYAGYWMPLWCSTDWEINSFPWCIVWMCSEWISMPVRLLISPITSAHWLSSFEIVPVTPVGHQGVNFSNTCMCEGPVWARALLYTLNPICGDLIFLSCIFSTTRLFNLCHMVSRFGREACRTDRWSGLGWRLLPSVALLWAGRPARKKKK